MSKAKPKPKPKPATSIDEVRGPLLPYLETQAPGEVGDKK